MDLTNVQLIGVDGGATEVKAHAVAVDTATQPPAYRLRSEAASRIYPVDPQFTPVPIAEQLAQRDAGRIEPTPAEHVQGRAWVAAAADAITEVARACGSRPVLVGAGMPGLKTPDGRGISAINNGPRIPDYLDALEAALDKAGVRLAAPLATLGSDADYCGLGEEHAADGLFRDVTHAYYVGCGTGIADALKLRGVLVPFDTARDWIMKAWQIPSALGPTFEKLVSARSLNAVYARLVATHQPQPPAIEHDAAARLAFPEQHAARGNPLAVAWIGAAALVLAELVFERLDTVYHGRAAAPHRGPAYARLQRDHPYRGTILDRVVIGQRLGQIYADPALRGGLADHFDRYLAALIATLGSADMTRAYLDTERNLRAGFVRASKLRAAPALGAAVAAVANATG